MKSISNNHVYINMNFYCNYCDKEVKTDFLQKEYVVN